MGLSIGERKIDLMKTRVQRESIQYPVDSRRKRTPVHLVELSRCTSVRLCILTSYWKTSGMSGAHCQSNIPPSDHDYSPSALVGTDRTHVRDITLHRPSKIGLNLQVLERILAICACLALARPRLRESRPVTMWYSAGRTDGCGCRDSGVGW